MKINRILLVAAVFISLAACTKLEEKLASTTGRGGSGGSSGSGNPATLLQGAYDALNGPLVDQTRVWASQEHSTDECLGPTRGGDWDDNGIWRVYNNHKWNADHEFITQTFNELARAQFAGTVVLDNNPSPSQAAQARFIRALAMFYSLDLYDQVPFRQTSLGDLTKSLPTTKKGTECADFIISELEAAIPNLPNGAGVGIATKDAARGLLVKVLLNKGVYANRANPTFSPADLNKAIGYADAILSNPSYSLTANFFDNFAPNNTTIGSEIVYSLQHDNGAGRGGNNQSRWYCTLHYNQNPSGWNGFTTLGDFYDKFETADKRRGGPYTGLTNVTGLRAGFLIGQQFNQNGVALKDRKDNNLVFSKDITPKVSGNDLEIKGIRVIKYIPDLAANFPANNDYVVLRLADIILMKAEAIARGGTATTAGPWGNTPAALVNSLRTHPSRGPLSPLATVTLDNIYDERGKELYWEGWRRNDMIRFGKFLAARQLKGATGNERLLYPIPNSQLTINSNLTQNPGY